MGKVIKAIFDQLGGNEVTTESRYQYDYGMVLKFGGAVTLPQAYEVHFALDKTGDAVTQIGGADGVTVPDSMFTSGSPIYAWVYLHDGETDGYTQYTAIIPVIKRAAPSDQEPTPVQQSAIDQAIAALGVAVEQTAADVETTTEKAAEAQASAEAAAASAAEAAETAENVEENVTAARAAKAAAEAARDRAVQAETSANQSKTAAASSEANAAASATAASASASAALTSEENANGAMMSAYSDANRADTAADTATSAKNDAVSAKNAAQSAKTSAETAATTATTKASEAAASATTASTAASTATTKAGEAATSATNAAASAQSVASSAAQITQNAEDIDALKEDLNQSNNELFRVSGYLNQNYVKGRQRYVASGVESFANNGRWISPAQGEYIELKSGDVIVAHQSDRYHFRVCYSVDNKATFTMSAEQTTIFTVPSDSVGWISIVTATTATDDDVETILNGHIIEILRNDANQVGKAISTANGIMNALEINPNSGFSIEAIANGTAFNYVNTTATENGGNGKLFEIPCAKDDVFRLTFDFQAMISPENFNDYILMVREIDQNEASPLRSVAFYLSELQTAVDFTVYHASAKKIIANVNLKRSSTTVSTGYYEEIKYSVTVIKVLEQNDVYTEAGEAWEV